MKKHTKMLIICLLLLFFILIVPFIIYNLFPCTFGIILPFYGSVLGGSITLCGLYITINNNRKNIKEENAIKYKPNIVIEDLDKVVHGALKRELNVGYQVSLNKDAKHDATYYFEKQIKHSKVQRLVFKNKGRGETYNTVVEKLELKPDWKEKTSNLYPMSSKLYVGEILSGDNFIVDIGFPKGMFLPKDNKEHVVRCELIINYSDMFNYKKYQLVTHFNMHVVPLKELNTEMTCMDKDYADYEVLWQIGDVSPEKRIYSDKKKKYIHEYDYIQEQSNN